MTFDVLFSPTSQDDLISIYDYITAKASSRIAQDYTERLKAFCLALANFPERGTRRDDVRVGLRVVGFQRRVAIAFHLDEDAVIIDRLFYGGQNIDSRLS